MTMRHVDTPQSVCRFGLAVGDITPPAGIYHRMWGAAAHDRATGVHRPLRATVMTFAPPEAAMMPSQSASHTQSQSPSTPKSPDDEQIVIALDHCLLWAGELNALLDSVSVAAGVDRRSLLVVFSHTHAAGLMGPERSQLPGGELIPGYLRGLSQRVGELVIEARRDADDVVLTYGRGRCDLAANRDYRDETAGQFVCGYNPDAPADDAVLVVRVTAVSGGGDGSDSDGDSVSDGGHAGALRAVIVNYACHPTTLAWQNTLISPDYPGAMRELVEQQTGTACVFVQGASGDLGPREGFVGDVAVADRNGRQLGYAVLSALAAMPPPLTNFTYTGPVVSGATIGTWAHQPLTPQRRDALSRWRLRRWTAPLDYRDDLPTRDALEAQRRDWQTKEAAARAAGDDTAARDCRAMVERQTRMLARLATLPAGAAFPFPIVMWQMGDAFWVAVEGEPYNLLQTELRRRCPGAPVFVAVLANGSRAWYLPPAELYGQGIYQESLAVLAPGCLEKLIDGIAGEIDAWRKPCAAAR